MGMFYFDVVSASGVLLRDETGVDLPDLEAAKREAREDGVTIACQRGQGHDRTILRIRDEQREVFTVSVHLVVIISKASN